MFDKLIPWKRTDQDSGNRLSERHDEDPFNMLRRDFDNLLSRFWEEGGMGRSGQQGGLMGAVDFDETENEYVLTAKLPGFDPANIDIKLSGNTLTVKAEHKEVSDGDSNQGRLRRYGSFYESFRLPTGANADAIDARYHNGVLELVVPKDDSAPSKRIEVKAA